MDCDLTSPRPEARLSSTLLASLRFASPDATLFSMLFLPSSLIRRSSSASRRAASRRSRACCFSAAWRCSYVRCSWFARETFSAMSFWFASL